MNISEKLSRYLIGTVYGLGLVLSPMANATNNPWVEVGECIVDYTSKLPDWLEGYVDSLISGGWSNNLEPEHPDAYLKVFTNSSEQEQIGNTIYRGFFAQDNNDKDWQISIFTWFLEDRVIYLNGVVIDSESRDNCSVYHRDYEYKSYNVGGVTVTGWYTDAGEAKSRHEIGKTYEPPGYHLFARNCQHFRDWVLTGQHTALEPGVF